MELLFVSARSVSVLLNPDGDYLLPSPVRLSLKQEDGAVLPLGEEKRSVVSLFDLTPDREYTLLLHAEDSAEEALSFRTEKESFTLNVRRFGAVGDGRTDDTAALQAAILSCPEGGRVLVPAGNYLTAPLFLKSHLTLELKKGAVLSLLTDPGRFPILPGILFPTEGEEDYSIGSWEGNPLDSYASALTGIGVEDIRIIGEGIVDGRARESTWWDSPKERKKAFRGHLLFLRNCAHITVQGITFRNSPAWNLHPLFCSDLTFLNISVEAPSDSPNTDGFDPQSCRGVKLFGARFSVGDDCIALKSGKIYMGRKYHTPCEDVEIAWCAMLDGHGGVTVGSEIAGGCRNVRVHHCWMRGNDRGLRVKTRRGRGKYAVIDGIVFEHIRMEDVKVPLVVNCMYFCDPDGHSAFVQSRDPQPVDDTTPTVGSITFKNVTAVGCHACVAYLLGLPERHISSLTVQNCRFSFRPDAVGITPAMADGIPVHTRRGIIARFVDRLNLEDVVMEGIVGEEMAEA